MAELQLAMACGSGDLQDLSLPFSPGRLGNPLFVEGRPLGTWDRSRRGQCPWSSCLTGTSSLGFTVCEAWGPRQCRGCASVQGDKNTREEPH